MSYIMIFCWELFNYGIRSVSLQLFRSFRSSRTQSMHIVRERDGVLCNFYLRKLVHVVVYLKVLYLICRYFWYMWMIWWFALVHVSGDIPHCHRERPVAHLSLCGNTKFLGLVTDHNLKFNHHYRDLSKKIVFCKLCQQFYFANVHSHLSYGIIFWRSPRYFESVCFAEKNY